MAQENPFIPDKPASGKEHFWGRHRELNELSQCLLDREEPQSCLLVGPPQIGKTSLLAHLLEWHQTPEFQLACSQWHRERLRRTIEVLISMKQLTAARADRFYQRLLQAINKQLEILTKRGKAAVNFPGEFSGNETLPALERFSELIRASCEAGYRFHFLLDDFADVFKNPSAFDDRFFNQLRLCAADYNVAWVVGGDHRLSAVADTADYTHIRFFGLLQQVTLGLLRPGESEELLSETVRRCGHALTSRECTELARLTGPHPAFLQLAGWHFYEARFSSSKSSDTALTEARRTFAQAAQSRYYDLWERLNTAERTALLQTLSAPHDQAGQSASFDTERCELLKDLHKYYALLNCSGESEPNYSPFGEGFAHFLCKLPLDPARTDEDEYEAFEDLAQKFDGARADYEHIKTALGLLREGAFEDGLRVLFPSIEHLAGVLIEQRQDMWLPERDGLGTRIEELRHLGAISQETFDLAWGLLQKRNNIVHGDSTAAPKQTARSAVTLGLRLIREASDIP